MYAPSWAAENLEAAPRPNLGPILSSNTYSVDQDHFATWQSQTLDNQHTGQDSHYVEVRYVCAVCGVVDEENIKNSTGPNTEP